MALTVECACHRPRTHEEQAERDEHQSRRAVRGKPGRCARTDPEEQDERCARNAAALGEQDARHGRTERDERRGIHKTTRVRNASNLAGPMPRTRLRSSTVANGPLASRSATIAAAVAGPTPGSASSCSASAVFTLI